MQIFDKGLYPKYAKNSQISREGMTSQFKPKCAKAERMAPQKSIYG